MKFVFLCKRHYTNRDLIAHRFGRLYHLPVKMAGQGCDGLVIAADYHNTKPALQETAGVKFYSLPFTLTKFVSFFRRCRRILDSCRPDIIIASGDTHLGAIGLFYARLLGVPFVFDVYDDYRTFGTNRLPGMKSLFNHIVKKADLVVCAGNPLKSILSKISHAVLVVENGVDINLFRPLPREEARRLAGVAPGKTIIGYFGAIEQNRGVKELAEAVSTLRQTNPDTLLLLAGKMDQQGLIGRSFIDYRGIVSQQEIARLIAACDVAVIPYLSHPQVDVCNPCKLAEYCACEVPIVATRVSDLSDHLSAIPQALCDPGQPEDMARAIAWQLKNRRVVRVPERLGWESLARQLLDALKSRVPKKAQKKRC